MLKIEFEAPNYNHCECCDSLITNLTRFVYDDEGCLGYYYAVIEPHHRKVVQCMVVLCEWDEAGRKVIKKTGFPLTIWEKNDNFNISLQDKTDCPWKNLTDVEILNREDSLKHPHISDIFHITDHIVTEDTHIINYFE
ncbi:hypothetical protein CAPN001_13230 [Capnocytophaga stomatis]|uniref:hypothetical protein n=1 Tax=Capnocytophaga stomatis TaxID=1848904 RepID=UPI0019513496|nr:hypothetical protein [Capnocytophaga stomatis]GIJ96754.1 hypothetical protein CAPN001_13230 [Capnocytophaga stomatis]